MKNERSNVEFPLWRKKVDSSLFAHKGTTIPTWACNMWGIQELFRECSSKKDKNSIVTIRFTRRKFEGQVTIASKGRKTPAYRLWFDDELCLLLKDTFLMSHMRGLEKSLSSDSTNDIETKIPFWEFLDIEFNASLKEFRFTSHYTQEPTFPELFKRLIGSPSMKKVDDELNSKEASKRINKQGWKPKEELDYEIGAENVIYTLIDTERKLLYVGEAKNLVKRLSQRYPSISHWNYFRYNVLPNSLESYRVPLERMIIRDFASILMNKKDVDDSISISDYRLANDKIDK